MSDELISSNFEQFQDLTAKRLLVDPTPEVLSCFVEKLKKGASYYFFWHVFTKQAYGQVIFYYF